MFQDRTEPAVFPAETEPETGLVQSLLGVTVRRQR